MNQPYTHAMHAHKCIEAAKAGHVLASQLVQVQKNRVTYCATIANAWTTENGGDCWTVISSSPEVARFTVSVRKVRECGQSDCSCAAHVPAASAARRACPAQAFAEVSK